MNRSIGVTVIAVLTMVGSALTFLMGILMVLMMAFVPIPPQKDFPVSPTFVKAILLMAALAYVIPALWGIFTSIGLFRLKNWARISIMVFSVLLILMGGFTGLVALLLPIPSVPNQDPAVMIGLRVAMGVFWFVQLGIGVWWLVFFNRAKVSQQFVSSSPMLDGTSVPPLDPTQVLSGPSAITASAPRSPVSLTIIAWFLLVSCVFVPLNLLLHTPAIFFTKLVNGLPAAFFYIIVAVLLLYIGSGLLRLKPAARIVGIAYFVFTLVNSAVFYLAPGGRARVRTLFESQQAMFPWSRVWLNQPALQLDLTPLILIGGCAGLTLLAVPLYFLITRKQAFEKAAGMH